ncbi:prepilin peptidase [Candidatus Margulisiibacteriota bacterium]
MQNTLELLKNIILLSLVLWATYSDIKTRKIPNKLTINGMLAGILIAMLVFAWQSGSFNPGGLWQGFISGFGGCLVALMLGVIPFAVGGLGGGDIKLLMLIGAFTGPVIALWTVLYTALAGGVVAVLFLIKRVIKKESLFGDFVKKLKEYKDHYVYQTELPKDSASGEKFPYSIAILAGLLMAFFLRPF